MKLVLSDASFSFRANKRPAVRSVSLELSQGERVAVVGESGSGKSTLVSIMAGLIAPTSGKALLDGKPIFDVGPFDRMIGFVPQRPPAMPGTSVKDLLLRPAMRERKSDNARRHAASVASSIGIGQLLDRSLGELSGGELQRAFIGRVLVWNPRFMLLDEPLSNIDMQRRRIIYPLLIEHAAKAQASLLLVTHDPSEAAILCDRVLVMKEGEIVADASVATMLSNPPHLHAASLFGGVHLNCIDGHLSPSGAESWTLHTPFGDVIGRFSGNHAAKRSNVPVSFLVQPDQMRPVASPSDRARRPLTRAGRWNSMQVWLDTSSSPALWVATENGTPTGPFMLDLAQQNVNIYDRDKGGLLGQFIGS